MKVSVEDVSSIEKRLSVELDAGVVTQELTQAYSTLGRQVKVPGFRPGHIPRRILEQRFRADVEADVARRLLSKGIYEAITEKSVDAVGEPEITKHSFKANEPFTFEARIEVRPNVVAKDYKGLKLPKVDTAVTDAKVDEQVEQLRKMRGTWAPVQGRDVAAKGDRVTIDFTATIDGKPFPGSEGKGVEVEVAPGLLIEGNVEGLAGVKLEGTTAVDFTFPADYRVEEVRSKAAKFIVTLKGISVETLPVLDDAFAEAVGAGVKTVAELKTRVRTDMEKSTKRNAERDERTALLKALVDKNPFEVPKSMLEHGVNVMLEGAVRQLVRSGVDPRYLTGDLERLRGEFRPQAELEVRGQLLLDAVAKQEKIEVKPEDFEKKVAEVAADSNTTVAQVQKEFRGEEQRRAFEARIREDKTLAFLKAAATYS